MSRLGRFACFCVWPFALAGCGVGALGQAALVDDKGHESARQGFDRPLAVGATVRPEIDYKLRGAGAPSMHYEAADEAVIAADNGVLRGTRAGLTSLLLVSDDGMVLDFFHLWVKEPTTLALRQVFADDKAAELSGRVELLPGEALHLSATLRGEGQDLGGTATDTWKVDGGAVAVLEEGRAGRRRVIALQPGRATLEVRMLDRIATLTIEVSDKKEKSR